jgi:hypothetical protein
MYYYRFEENKMSKKSVFWRVSLLVSVIALVNLYSGCVHKYYMPGSEPEKAGSQKIQQQEQQIATLHNELDELKTR